MADYDEEMLTEEERAALKVDGDDAGVLDDSDPTGGEDDVDAKAAAAAGDDDGDDGDDGDESSAPAPKIDPVDPNEPDPAPQEQQQAAPRIDTQAAEQTLNAYKDDRKALLDKFNDGDLTDDEFAAEIDALEETVTEARVQKHVAAQQERQEDMLWESAVEQHMQKYPEFSADQRVLQALNRIVLDVTADPDYAGMSFAEQLENAHALLEVKAQRIGMKGVPKMKAAGTAQQRTAPKGEDLGSPPRTLAYAPASEITDNDDEFSALRALEESDDHDGFEAAMARMSPEERDRYSSQA